jgi:hypothetical protein
LRGRIPPPNLHFMFKNLLDFDNLWKKLSG